MLTFYLSMIDETIDKLRFNDLYEKYKTEVMQYAISIVKNHHDAEEVSQEVWLVIARRLDELRFENEKSLKAFLMKIVKHKSVDVVRKRKIMSDYISDPDSSMDTLPTDYDSVLLAICQRESVDTIHRCINALDEIYRDVLSFYYFHQRSAREIADFLSMDVRAVRKRIERGRSMLINLLMEKGEINGEQL